ncbi:unnamed protein product [Cunninghamella blakesleeana]
MVDIEKIILERKLQEYKVLNAELGFIKPSSKVYQRQVPTSNVYFLEKDKNLVKSNAKYQQQGLEKKIKELK